MIFKPELGNKEDVLKWYTTRGNHCYLLFTGVKCDARQLLSKHLIDEDGTENLETVLSFISQNNSNTNVYTIISVPYFEGIENKRIGDLEGETIRFQFNTSTYSNNGQTITKEIFKDVSAGNEGYKAMVEMLSRQNQDLMNKLENMQNSLLEMQEQDEDEDEDNQPPLSAKDRLMGAVAGIIEKPQFGDMLLGVVGMALQKFMPQQPPPQEPQNEDYE